MRIRTDQPLLELVSSVLYQIRMKRNVRSEQPGGCSAGGFSALALLSVLWAVFVVGWLPTTGWSQQDVDFNRDIRPILSNNCYKCHGPDAAERKGGRDGLRLDTPAGAYQDLGGYAAIVPGKPAESELLRRVRSQDPAERMPPPETGKALSAAEIALLERWIAAGALYDQHWSYRPVVRPPLPSVRNQQWPRNAIDYFVLHRLEREGLGPSAEADREALIRRVTLDLTGLPPTPTEVDAFLADVRSDAYERLVDRLLASPAYGEHWARMWLDLVRYADSAGYADDPPRTIWAYRDYVIRALNNNVPFDQFTVEQLAGDLLPQPTQEQLIATAMHRNTLTNNEGGTNDEEFRNVAVVDRVNTTFAVWMGTTIQCAQCHNHKYDPISQKEFFQVFAIFNNTQDADRRDESPVLEVWTEEQQLRKQQLQEELHALQARLQNVDESLRNAEILWEQRLAEADHWRVLVPVSAQSQAHGSLNILPDHSVQTLRPADRDVTETVFAIEQPMQLAALRLEALPDAALPRGGPGWADGNFILSRVELLVEHPSQPPALQGRFVRVDLPGENRILSLAEVQVFSGAKNVAPNGSASQSSTDFGGEARRAIDGNTDGRYQEAQSTTHTAASRDPWWELDLKDTFSIERIVIWNRTDGGLHTRLNGFRLSLLDEKRQVVWQQTVARAPEVYAEYPLGGPQPVALREAVADLEQEGFPARAVLAGPAAKGGWAIGNAVGQQHRLVLIPANAVAIPAGARLIVRLGHEAPQAQHTLGRWRIAATEDAATAEAAALPAELAAILKKPREQRSAEEQRRLDQRFLETSSEVEPLRQRQKALEKQLAEIKPHTTVPIMRELPPGQRRETRIQRRGNFLDLAEPVEPGVPEVFRFTASTPANRLELAQWLIDPRNPLTARVMANRLWEQIFGTGLVRTSEEFGVQGELPSHPELLDWLAAELTEGRWDLKKFLRLLVTSATYRQSSQVSEALLERDPENRLLARGPRFRMTAEMIRDQALFVGGLLSTKMYGEPVRPPQPKLGVNAAFGSGIDWQPSEGEDRYRRAIYTTWRRSNPYPSMVTFDAPNREVCTLRRDRTNTPLQALVTLNDPVYMEAAQGLARKMLREAATPAERVMLGFRWSVARIPTQQEVSRLVSLYERAHQRLADAPDQSRLLAGMSTMVTPADEDPVELAAWTVVANVLLNLDECFMRR